MEALDQLLMACHSQSIKPFVESFLHMVAKLLESGEPKLQVLGTNSVSKPFWDPCGIGLAHRRRGLPRRCANIMTCERQRGALALESRVMCSSFRATHLRWSFLVLGS